MFISDYLAAQKSCWLCKMSFVRLNFANHDNGGQWLMVGDGDHERVPYHLFSRVTSTIKQKLSRHLISPKLLF